MQSELDEKRARFRKEFSERKVQINDSYERMLRVLDEHIRRHEQYMMHWGHKNKQKDAGAWQREGSRRPGSKVKPVRPAVPKGKSGGPKRRRKAKPGRRNGASGSVY